MANMLETPPDFPGLDEVEEGDVKKFLVKAKCTGKEDDGAMEWEVQTIDGVKPESPEDEQGESDQDDTEDQSDDGIDENYDDSQDEGGDEDMTPAGKPKTTKGIGILIVHGKPK